MKFYDFGIIVFIVIALAAIVGAVSIEFLGNDNAVEEAAEKVIEIETGKNIDLSPGDEHAASKG